MPALLGLPLPPFCSVLFLDVVFDSWGVSLLLVSVPSGETVSSSFALLKKAEVKLREIVRDKLSQAVQHQSRPAVER